MTRYAASLSCLLLLAACVSPLQQLKSINPSGDDFASALAAEYLSYADSEAEQGRKLAAEYYAQKGVKAIKGENVEPEKADTSLPFGAQQELAAGRSRLVALLNDEVKRAAPQKLARAQLLFDCWQHELSKDLNQERAPCAEEFAADLAEVQQWADEASYDREETHIFAFAAGGPRMSQADRAFITQLGHRLSGQSHYAVEIEVHSAGSASHTLSEARLAAVHKALAAAGIAEKHIEIVKEDGARKVTLHCAECKEDDNKLILKVKTPRKVRN